MDTAKELNEMRKKTRIFLPIYVIFMNEEPEKKKFQHSLNLQVLNSHTK